MIGNYLNYCTYLSFSKLNQLGFNIQSVHSHHISLLDTQGPAMFLLDQIYQKPTLFISALILYLTIQYLAYTFKRSKRLKVKELWVRDTCLVTF